MKRLILAVTCGLWLALSGCQTFYSPPRAVNPAAAQSPAEVVKASINAGLVALISIAQTIDADLAAGLMLPHEHAAYRERIRDAKSRLDDAWALADLGNVADAQKQAEAVTKLINALRLQIATKARDA